MDFFQKACLGVLLLLPHGAHVLAEPTSIEVFADNAKYQPRGDALTVPHNTSSLRFYIKPQALRVRYKLDGLDQTWRERTDEMLFIIRFLDKTGDQISQESFPANGTSAGWNGSVEKSTFTSRREIVTVPTDADSLIVVMSSAGPASVVGVLAVSEITITSLPKGNEPPVTYLKNSRVPGTDSPYWIKSGTHPSMGSVIGLDADASTSPVLVILDDDTKAHADLVSPINALPKVRPGESLDLQWKETYSTGTGGPFSATYERLPSGTYNFTVEELSITGLPLNTKTIVSVKVPRPYWKNFWFWAACSAVIGVLSTLIGRQLIRKRIQRHLQQAQLIADERLRIARDLHDDLGTRLSHISLLGAYAESNSSDDEARASFGQITAMSRELISALSETVWMLNPKNNQLEALVDFLCRLVTELCRLAEIRCRIDAMSVTENTSITHEFRHNVSLAVKEVVNNALKHSHATEIKMTIQLEEKLLRITITDNGIGFSQTANKTGLGLENITQRMSAIRGNCSIDQIENEGLKISLEAPIN